MTTALELPEPGAISVEDRVQISRRLIQEARDELDNGDRRQATKKIWGALEQLLKAHGQRRGWLNLDGHRTVGHIAIQLAAEYHELRITDAYIAADNGHRNFYDNEMSPPEIEGIIATVAKVLPDLESALNEPPRPFTIREGDLWRLQTLTGKQNLVVGDTSPVGFSNTRQPPETALPYQQ